MTDTDRDDMATGVEEIHLAWKSFERRLLTLIEAMQYEGDEVVLEVGGSREVPTATFRMSGGVLLATIGDDEYSENHAIGREPLVHRAIMLLRNIAGVPHPDLLTHRASGPCAAMSPVLGLAWTGGARPPLDFYFEPDRDRVLEIVEEAIGEDHEVDTDDDGDLFIEHLGQRVFVRVVPDAPAVEVFTRVVHGAHSRRQAAVEVSLLNRMNPWVRWQLFGRDIVQTSTVDAMPFSPHHLRTTLGVFLESMSATRDDLAFRVGGEVA